MFMLVKQVDVNYVVVMYRIAKYVLILVHAQFLILAIIEIILHLNVYYVMKVVILVIIKD